MIYANENPLLSNREKGSRRLLRVLVGEHRFESTRSGLTLKSGPDVLRTGHPNTATRNHEEVIIEIDFKAINRKIFDELPVGF